MWPWFFRRDIRVEGEKIDLVLEQKVCASHFNQWVPSLCYGIYLHGTDIRIGCCDLRLGMNEELYYAGNIGYTINPDYRGHHYAYQACLLLFDVALSYDMNQLIITCSPENIASRKTLQKLKGEYLETTEVPRRHWLYQRGEPIKEIYRYYLKNKYEESVIGE